jgi:GT2 family glycosyltransferase
LKKDTPLVSVIVVNWNGQRFLRKCLDSLTIQTFTDFEIIVVDNGSQDASVVILETQYQGRVHLVKNDVNEGFAQGNNRGINRARGAYIVTLNIDTIADKNWLRELLVAAENDPTVGMCGSKILLVDKPSSIDSVGVNIYPDGMSRQRGHLEPNDGRYETIEEILLPSACAALYRKVMLDEIGLFDTNFFAYCEDTDLGLRGRLAGWKAVLVPTAVVYHHYSGTAGRQSAFKAYHVERNHFWLALKNMPIGMLMMLPFFSMIRLAAQCRDMVHYKSKASPNDGAGANKIKILAAVLHAYLSMMIGIPGMLHKRFAIQSRKKISDRTFRLLFKRFGLRLRELRLDP